MVTSPTSPNKRKSWRASAKTVQVKCPRCKDVRGVAAANAVGEDAPPKFRASCPSCDGALVAVEK